MVSHLVSFPHFTSLGPSIFTIPVLSNIPCGFFPCDLLTFLYIPIALSPVQFYSWWYSVQDLAIFWCSVGYSIFSAYWTTSLATGTGFNFFAFISRTYLIFNTENTRVGSEQRSPLTSAYPKYIIHVLSVLSTKIFYFPRHLLLTSRGYRPSKNSTDC